MKRDKFDAIRDKRANVNNCEASGLVADSMDVRLQLMKKVKAGEITLSDAQSQLKIIKKAAKKNGMLTRNQAFLRG